MTVSLVTGGAGFIGSHLVTTLLNRGDSVRVLDNFSTGKRENLMDINGPLNVIEGDLRNPSIVQKAVQGADIIFHQAAEVSVPRSMIDPKSCYDINVQGTLNLLDAAVEARVQKVVMASSCAVYGDSGNFPLEENQPGRPLSPYAASKQITEVFASLYTRAYDLPVVALRYFNVYGPRQSPDSEYAAVIPIFIHRIINGLAPVVYGDGNQKRDFVFINDIVKANLIAASVPEAAGHVINICTGREYTLQDLLDALTELFPESLEPIFDEPRFGDIYRSVGSPKLAKELLGFNAQVDFVDGLAETQKWIRT